MDMLLSPWIVTLAGGGFVIAMYILYRAALPHPLAGMPYNKDAAAKLFGDVPEMMRYVMHQRQIFCWLTSLTKRHQSPIVQVFIKPMSLPWVVLTDPRESQDILLRRTKEFDRSAFFGELVGGILPEQHISFLSTDARFKDNRNLINHLMAPSFIREVSGPAMYESVCTLMKLWRAKCIQAAGHPFSAHHDLTFWALDSIFASSFGLEEADSNTVRRLHAVEQGQNLKQKHQQPEEPILFPDGEVPAIFQAVLTLSNSVTDTQLSPAPALTSWILRKFPYMRKAKAIKDAWLRERTEEAIALLESDTTTPHSALHSVLMREREVAAKAGRLPAYRKRAIADEFFGFMVAGHDTTATAAAWGVKFLADHPEAQNQLRDSLRTMLPTAVAEKRAPTYLELVKTPLPYLDAVVEEVLRHANTIAFVVRTAQTDTAVLGRHIPKGTDVFLMANGSGYLEPALPVEDAERSPGARRGHSTKGVTGDWDDTDIHLFKPGRWLRTDPSTGVELFDPMAGPSLAFGLGPRACFGRRLALQSLRVHFAMTVWHFSLLQVSPDLSTYKAVQRFAREPTHCYLRLELLN
ncbi:cytochrome P450 [Periconia macrospinosa]|uniref:Cytochrome P450 n=1 Tax=Periconia macrospinosa TaxID=97972 RepID=A0A2V1DPD4_9PLEO|nr:cytochrome P450 [Periconia macrospinosa]